MHKIKRVIKKGVGLGFCESRTLTQTLEKTRDGSTYDSITLYRMYNESSHHQSQTVRNTWTFTTAKQHRVHLAGHVMCHFEIIYAVHPCRQYLTLFLRRILNDFFSAQYFGNLRVLAFKYADSELY